MAFDAEQTDEIRAIAGALLGDLVGQNGTYGELRQQLADERKAQAKAERDAAKAADVPPEREVPTVVGENARSTGRAAKP